MLIRNSRSFGAVFNDSPNWPSVDPLSDWIGAFVIPNALPGIPYGDGKRIWTPAFGCYTEDWQHKICEQIARRYPGGKVPYNWVSLPYGEDYPELAADPVRARQDLSVIRSYGLEPLPVILDDRRTDTGYAQPFIDACGDLFRIYMVMWEMNMRLGVDEFDEASQRWRGIMFPAMVALHNWMPDHKMCVHWTPGHGSGGNPEALWMRHMSLGYAPQGIPAMVKCVLSQTDFFTDPVHTGVAIESSAVRYNGSIGGDWAGLSVLTTAFEQTTTPVYHNGWTEQQQVNFTSHMLPHCPSVIGFGDGGPNRVKP